MLPRLLLCMCVGLRQRRISFLNCHLGMWYGNETSSVVHVAMLECGYCGKAVQPEDKWLPVECHKCQGLFHLGCLKGERPPALMGDQLFHFTCAYCSPLGNEQCYRPNLQWVYVTHLVLYNLMVQEGGRHGFFRWNEDICGFIQANWMRLMPHRKRTQSWHSTVAGTLSVHCPAIFKSGFNQFGEHGWWSLTKLSPPDSHVALGTGTDGRLLGKRGSGSTLVTEGSSVKRSKPTTGDNQPKLKRHFSQRTHTNSNASAETSSTTASKEEPTPTIDFIQPPLSGERPDPSLRIMTERQEEVLLENLLCYQQAVMAHPKASRLVRKLKVRALQRNHGLTPFDLDRHICGAVTEIVKYVVDESKPYYEQIVPILQPGSSTETGRMRKKQTSDSKTDSFLRDPPPVQGSDVLDRLSLIPVLSRPLAPEYSCFEHYLTGEGSRLRSLTSPYTARVLKPYIFRTSELRPLKPRVLGELVDKHRRKLFDCSKTCDIPEYVSNSVDFCYLQPHHLPAVNALVSHFFWPVDLSECLQYPDFTTVVLYGRLVIGCGFMTPDIKVNEAYISFLLVHPDFRHAGIGKIMLYHLVQTCMGKDVTLHVSVDNPAMLLYQKFGFKAERYCLDFYEKYYPPGHHLSKHAYLMRLRR